MLEQVMTQFDLSLDIEPVAGGFITFLRLYKNNASYLIGSAAGKSISEAILKLERKLADTHIGAEVEKAKAVLA